MERNMDSSVGRSFTDAELQTVTGGRSIRHDKWHGGNAFVEGFDGFFVNVLGIQDGHGKGPIHHMSDSGSAV